MKVQKAVRNYLKRYDKILNENCLPFPDKEMDGSYILNILKSFGGGATHSKASTDAFTLKQAAVGHIKPIYFKTDPRTLIIIRRRIGIAAWCRLLKNPSEENVHKLFSPMVKELFLTLEKEVGFSKDKISYGFYGTFMRPDGYPIILRECDNCAGYEFRLYSNCISGEDV